MIALLLMLFSLAAMAWEPPPVTDTGLVLVEEAPAAQEAPPPLRAPPAQEASPTVGPIIAPMVVQPQPVESPQQPARNYLPGMPLRGFRAAVLFSVLGLLCLLGELVLRLSSRHLAPQGFLPRTIETTRVVLRVLMVILGIALTAALLPRFLSPALPLFLVAVAVAVGWSARDLLPDLIAGIVIIAERRIRPGYRLIAGDQVGVVESVGLRATWLRDESGQRLTLPNRVLVTAAVTADDQRWPMVEARINSMPGADTGRTRTVLHEAAVLSPWVAPEGEIIALPAAERGQWRVRVRLLEARYAERFEAALQEELDCALSKGMLTPPR